MQKRLSSPEMLNAEHGELETYVIEEGRELQRLLLQAQMELRAARERRVEARGADGVRRTTMRASSRPLTTLVGPVVVPRTAYQARDVGGLHQPDGRRAEPDADAALSRGRAIRGGACRGSVVRRRKLELVKQTGARVAKAAGRGDRRAGGRRFDAFYAEQRAANDRVESTGDLLVMTFDAKGIVMVPEDLRPATKKAARQATRKLATRLTSGEKRNRKRMAKSIYSVPRHVRTPAKPRTLRSLHALRPGHRTRTPDRNGRHRGRLPPSGEGPHGPRRGSLDPRRSRSRTASARTPRERRLRRVLGTALARRTSTQSCRAIRSWLAIHPATTRCAPSNDRKSCRSMGAEPKSHGSGAPAARRHSNR
jgi:hypothetical protein